MKRFFLDTNILFDLFYNQTTMNTKYSETNLSDEERGRILKNGNKTKEVKEIANSYKTDLMIENYSLYLDNKEQEELQQRIKIFKDTNNNPSSSDLIKILSVRIEEKMKKDMYSKLENTEMDNSEYKKRENISKNISELKNKSEELGRFSSIFDIDFSSNETRINDYMFKINQLKDYDSRKHLIDMLKDKIEPIINNIEIIKDKIVDNKLDLINSINNEQTIDYKEYDLKEDKLSQTKQKSRTGLEGLDNMIRDAKKTYDSKNPQNNTNNPKPSTKQPSRF